jgi:hypothetical protein
VRACVCKRLEFGLNWLMLLPNTQVPIMPASSQHEDRPQAGAELGTLTKIACYVTSHLVLEGGSREPHDWCNCAVASFHSSCPTYSWHHTCVAIVHSTRDLLTGTWNFSDRQRNNINRDSSLTVTSFSRVPRRRQLPRATHWPVRSLLTARKSPER